MDLFQNNVWAAKQGKGVLGPVLHKSWGNGGGWGGLGGRSAVLRERAEPHALGQGGGGVQGKNTVISVKGTSNRYKHALARSCAHATNRNVFSVAPPEG